MKKGQIDWMVTLIPFFLIAFSVYVGKDFLGVS